MLASSPTFQMERLHTSDYRGYNWPQLAEEEDGYPL